MKVTTNSFTYLTQLNGPLPAQVPGLRCVQLKQFSTLPLHAEHGEPTFSSKPCQRSNSPCSLIHKRFYGFADICSVGNELSDTCKMNKALRTNRNFCLFNPTPPPALHRVSTTYVPTSKTPTTAFLLSPQTWFFSFATRELHNENTRIQLTAIEALLIRALVLSAERICSKQDLIAGIGKDPHAYSGLEMCLSRLQNKFRECFDERLFRSVRNRGYCLVQDVKVAK